MGCGGCKSCQPWWSCMLGTLATPVALCRFTSAAGGLQGGTPAAAGGRLALGISRRVSDRTETACDNLLMMV